jgi:hypothetical protein
MPPGAVHAYVHAVYVLRFIFWTCGFPFESLLLGDSTIQVVFAKVVYENWWLTIGYQALWNFLESAGTYRF